MSFFEIKEIGEGNNIFVIVVQSHLNSKPRIAKVDMGTCKCLTIFIWNLNRNGCKGNPEFMKVDKNFAMVITSIKFLGVH